MGMDETKRVHDISLIDEICNMIRLSCKEQEIVRLVNQYQIEEARLINMEQGKQLTEENQIDSSSQAKAILPQDIVIDLNLVGTDKIAPIHAACSVGNESVLNYLLFKKFVDPNVRAQTSEWVPLELACWHGHPRVVNILLKDKRTNLNYSHPQRGSCLHLASKGQHFQIVQMLLMHNIDFTIKTSEGKLAKEVTNSKQILNIIAWYEKNQNNKIEDKNAVTNVINEINEEENEDDEASSFTPSPNLENNLVKQAAKRAAQEGSEEEEDKSSSPPNQKPPFSVLSAANERASMVAPKMAN